MKKICAVICLVFVSWSSANAAEWVCGQVSPGGYIRISTRVDGRNYHSDSKLIPTNEKVDDFLIATKSPNICIKGRWVSNGESRIGSYFAYDIKVNQ